MTDETTLKSTKLVCANRSDSADGSSFASVHVVETHEIPNNPTPETENGEPGVHTEEHVVGVYDFRYGAGYDNPFKAGKNYSISVTEVTP